MRGTHIEWTEGLNDHQVCPWPWPSKVICKDLLDSVTWVTSDVGVPSTHLCLYPCPKLNDGPARFQAVHWSFVLFHSTLLTLRSERQLYFKRIVINDLTCGISMAVQETVVYSMFTHRGYQDLSVNRQSVARMIDRGFMIWWGMSRSGHCWGYYPGPCLKKRTVFPRYGDSHVKDKTVARLSYLLNGDPYTCKMSSL